jgi:hypothetical protein
VTNDSAESQEAQGPTFWRSPHFTDAQLGNRLNFEQKVLVFADRVRSWQLDVAERQIRADPHAGFAVLSAILSYFEMYAKHREGFTKTGESGHYFRKGVEWVFERVDVPAEVRTKVAERLWTAARNGLYHDGLTSAGIVLSSEFDSTMRVMGNESGEIGEVHINPERLVEQVQIHFSGYLLRLLNPGHDALRQNFEKRFDWRESGGDTQFQKRRKQG